MVNAAAESWRDWMPDSNLQRAMKDTGRPKVLYQHSNASCNVCGLLRVSILYHPDAVSTRGSRELRTSLFGPDTCSCRTCAGCFTQAKRMKVCSRCRGRAYCCQECQDEDWPHHKETCTPA